MCHVSQASKDHSLIPFFIRILHKYPRILLDTQSVSAIIIILPTSQFT